MKKLLVTTLFVLCSFPALALSLDEGRAKGLIGEQTTGYVAPISSSAEAIRLATDVNAKRKQEYLRISKENGQPVDVVGKVAANEIIARLPKGAQYQDASGNWQAK